MANDIITTLHPDNDENTNLFPNIKKENIPEGSIDRSKLDSNVNGLLNNIGELHPSGVDTSINILAFTTNKGIYIGSDTGYWYYWNGTEYVSGGVYQSIQIADDSISYNNLDEELKDKLNSCIKKSYYKIQSYTKVNNRAYNNVTNSIETLSGFYYTSISVNSGDRFKVSGWGSGIDYAPTFLHDDTIIEVENIIGQYTDAEIITPSNANRLILNGRSGVKDVVIYKYIVDNNSIEFWNEFESKTYKKCSVEYTSNVINVYHHDLLNGYDLITRFSRKAMNNLMDFYGWYIVPNNTEIVLTNHNADDRIGILAGQTDFIQPFKIWAVNNIDGDFTDPSVRKFTGGWHGYNNQTSGDYSATARNDSISIICDGKIVSEDTSIIGDNIVIKLVNYLQASNTEKENGSGREVMKAIYTITFSSYNSKIYVDCTIHALEEIYITDCFGLAYYRSSLLDECRAIGSRNHREAFTLADSLKFDKNTNFITEYCANGDVSLGIDKEIDLGSGYANELTYNFDTSSGKVYSNYILTSTPLSSTSGLYLNTNDEIYFRGYYDVKPKHSGD